MRVLIVVAHPDDEVLGCGGTVAALAAKGAEIYSCILCSKVTARAGKPDDSSLYDHVLRAQRELGIADTSFADFPNIAFNTVPHLELVRRIEESMLDTDPSVVITHHPGDLNNDHLHTSLACQAAARVSQRRGQKLALQGLYYMEVPSSTDWALPGHGIPFVPTSFCEIGSAGLAGKLKALAHYEGVMRPYPHSRSAEAITGLAAYRGAQSGTMYAEAFQTAFARLDSMLVSISEEKNECISDCLSVPSI
jgi:LmbE family N-acetylglucosaminyl deacetylase